MAYSGNNLNPRGTSCLRGGAPQSPAPCHLLQEVLLNQSHHHIPPLANGPPSFTVHQNGMKHSTDITRLLLTMTFGDDLYLSEPAFLTGKMRDI